MFRRGRILVIDDDPTSRLELEAAARALRHEAATAPGGRAGLDARARDGADLVLLDLLMPDCDGFEALRASRGDPDLAGVPVLVVSGTEEVVDVARAIELGAEDVLPKSFDPVQLRARVEAAPERRRLRLVEADRVA